MSGGPDFSRENFNTDDVEVLIGGQAVQVLVEAYAGTKQSQDMQLRRSVTTSPFGLSSYKFRGGRPLLCALQLGRYPSQRSW
jgi:hypothetical protein